jgi:hypothetical protein
MTGVSETVYSLETLGARAAYIPGLPEQDETGSATDFSAPDFEQARNASSGIAAAFDEYQRAAQAIAIDPAYDKYRAPYRTQKMAEARAAAAKPSRL